MSLSPLFAAASSFSTPATDDSSSQVASSGSTPPTTVADSASVHSEPLRHDVMTVADDGASISASLSASLSASASALTTASTASTALLVNVPSPRRARRPRASSPVYNLARLSGTSAHGKRRSKGDVVADRRRRTVSGADALMASGVEPGQTANEAIDALHLKCSLARLDTPRSRRQPPPSPRSLRSSSRLVAANAPVAAFALTSKLSTMSKRSRRAVDKAVAKIPRELRRLQDTKEFSHIDDIPVIHTVWSNGKYVNASQPTTEPSARSNDRPSSSNTATTVANNNNNKKTKVETPENEPKLHDVEPITQPKRRKAKKFLYKGLYAGQESPEHMARGLTTAEKKQLAQLPELAPRARANDVMPLPIFTGFRTLLNGRDFKLPYNICNPLPPGQPKPDEWKKMTKNRFIGDSKEYWKKMPHMHDYQSKCVCVPEDGCGESCQNRIMLYECDETNCNIGKPHCTNRAFAELTARRTKGGKYRIGVEVIKTSDRGHGVRSNRCFEPHQIIMEYSGEIITEEECERRMNELYKNNECYYLMSFDQNMIIDATTGSIARFVNHSCNPNCRMIKWIVSGQPRMALFAGDGPIMTGDELTYDYNFDPFSAKNVQKCLCGQPNCRGVLGPKPREVKVPKANLKNAVKATVNAGKRKLKELIGDDGEEGEGGAKAKRRKVQPAKGAKKSSLSDTSLKAAKGAATAIKKKVSAMTGNAKKTATGAKSCVGTSGSISKKMTATATATATTTKTATAAIKTKRVIKTYGSGAARARRLSSSSRFSSKPIAVARGHDAKKKASETTSPRRETPMRKAAATSRTTTITTTTTTTTTDRKSLVSGED